MKTLECIFIGERFYTESGTMMSPIYGVDGSRQDWGFVQCRLRAGGDVHIRPATEDEMAKYQAILDDMKGGA